MKTQMKANGLMAMVVAALVGCSSVTESTPGAKKTSETKSDTKVATSPKKEWMQIERLGRPAINEGLVITNDFLNAFNSIPPTADLSAAAAPVLAEAGAVLTAIYNYGQSKGLPAPAVGDVVAGFLPDVMRIDTRLSVPVGNWAYNHEFVVVQGTAAGAMLTAGRKIEDDVADITLSYLIAGNPICGPNVDNLPYKACTVPDGVSYASGQTCANAGKGSNVASPGHKCLASQTTRNGSASFPFLAQPH